MNQFQIAPARSERQIATVRELFTEYERWLGLDLSFQGFAEELALLPGAYAAPEGRLLLGMRGDDAAGCVAMRRIDEQRCEMKRLYVRPRYAGAGLGRALVGTLIGEARGLGYRVMLLDTLPQMQAAQHLYDSFGFQETPPYRFNPVPGARYLALRLS